MMTTLTTLFLLGSALAQEDRWTTPRDEGRGDGGESSPIPLPEFEPFGFKTHVQLDYLVARNGLEELMAAGTIIRYDVYDDAECKNLAWTGYDYLDDPNVIVHALDRITTKESGLGSVAEIRTIRELITDRPLRGAFLTISADGIDPQISACQPQRLSRPPDPPKPTGWLLMDSWPSVTYASAHHYDPYEKVTLGTTDEKICALNMVDQADNTVLFGGWTGSPRCEVSKHNGVWELSASIGSDDDAGSYDSASWSVCSAICWEIANPVDVYPWWQMY